MSERGKLHKRGVTSEEGAQAIRAGIELGPGQHQPGHQRRDTNLNTSSGVNPDLWYLGGLGKMDFIFYILW